MKKTCLYILFLLVSFNYCWGQSGKQKYNVGILVFKGAQVIDYAGPFEVLGQAGYNVFTVADSTMITTNMNMKIAPVYTLENCPALDVLVVSGGGGCKPGEAGVGSVINNEKLLTWVRQKADEAKYVMSVCNGAFILAYAGLLKNLEATTFWGMLNDLKNYSPDIKVVSNKRYTDNGKILTTAGLSSGIDGSLYLVSKLSSMGKAQSVALNMEYNWQPEKSFARANLADKYLHFDYYGKEKDWDYYSSKGTEDFWLDQYTIPKTNGDINTVFSIVNKAIAENHTWDNINYNWKQKTEKSSAIKSFWSFTDENQKTREAIVSIDENNNNDYYIVTIEILKS